MDKVPGMQELDRLLRFETSKAKDGPAKRHGRGRTGNICHALLSRRVDDVMTANTLA